MKRIPSLDGLRGVAIIAVVVAHCWHVEAGTLGVDLFFLLSGYLITNLLIQEGREHGGVSLTGFYKRRAVRLLPALSMMLVGFCAYEVLVERAGWHGPLDVLLGISYGANLVAPRLISPGLRHLWSLAMEEQFYLVWPIVIVALMSRLTWQSITRVLIVAAFAVVAAAYFAMPYLGPLGAWGALNAHLAPLLLGCAVATASVQGKAHISGRQASVALGILIPTVAAFAEANAFLLIPVAGACSAVLMLAVLERPAGPAARALSFEPLGAIGRTSYGIYLWHFPLLIVTHHDVPLTLLLTGLAVTLSYRYVERPLVRLRKRPRRTGPMRALEPVTQ